MPEASLQLTTTLVNWALGVLTIGTGGIISMNVLLWRLHQRLSDHENHCLLKHADHTKRLDHLQTRVEKLADDIP